MSRVGQVWVVENVSEPKVDPNPFIYLIVGAKKNQWTLLTLIEDDNDEFVGTTFDVDEEFFRMRGIRRFT